MTAPGHGLPGLGHAIAPSAGQSGIWVQNKLGAKDAYNISFAYRLGRTLGVDRLRASLNASIERHEAFRTIFREVDGKLVGTVLADPAPVGVPLEHTTAALVAMRLTALRRTPFNLSTERLVRVSLLDVDHDHYVLAITVHHIVFDDWSMGLWLTELADQYRWPHHAKPDDQAMRGYREWAAARRTSVAHDARLSSAIARIEGASERLDLPRVTTDPGARRGWTGSATETVLDQSLNARVRAVAQEHGCTDYVLYLAVWTTLVSLYAQHDDVTVGTPVADRLGAGADSLVGYFLNTVVVRHRVPTDGTFVDALTSARDDFYDSIEHSDVSYEEVVRRAAGRREDPSAPLFSTWFAFDDGTADLELEGVDVERLDTPTTTAKFELSLFVSLSGDHARIALEYADSIYERSVVEKMLQHYRRLLEIVTEDPRTRIQDVDVLTDDERDALERWGRREGPLQPARNIAAQFALAAQRDHDAIALEHGDMRVGYAELKAMADRVAARLEVMGVRSGDIVGVSVARSPAMVAAVLGVLTLGAAYLALDPTYPAVRLQHMVDDTGVRVVLTDEATADQIAPLDVLTVDAAFAAADRSLEPFVADAQDPRSLAYVTYTSGSTGNPKGIRMTHAAVWNLLAWQQSTYASVGRGHRTLQFAALSFDVSAQEIFGTLCSGGVLVLIDQAERDAVHAIMAVIRDRRVERVFLAAPALLEAVESAVALGVVPDTLRVVVSGSEQLVVTDALRTFMGRLSPKARIHNEYGPSETHVATMHEAPADPLNWPMWMPVGRPIGDTEIRLLDAHGRRMPPGSVGEICIAGPGLADGYSRLPGATARAFVPDPYGVNPGGRMYRTGDLARYLPEGVLEFLGRRDTQVKIRGFRVELEEIRAVLDAASPVRQSFVMVSGAPRPGRIYAFWVPAADTVGADGAVWSYLHDRLPAYMLPARLVEVPSFPLTIHGKVDQRALIGAYLNDEPAPVHTPQLGPSGSPLTQAIAAAMADVLGLASVGEHDDFFALGGHSLLANRLVWTLQAQQIASVSLRAVFDARSAARLAWLAGPPGPEPVHPASDAGAVADQLTSLLDLIGSSDPDDSAAESRS